MSPVGGFAYLILSFWRSARVSKLTPYNTLTVLCLAFILFL